MSRLDSEEVLVHTERPEYIRNMCLVGDSGHLLDALASREVFCRREDYRYYDRCCDDRERIPVHCPYMVLRYTPNTHDDYFMNLVPLSDCTPDAMSSLLITDGALLVVDAIKGLDSRLERLLPHVLQEYNTPVLFIDNFDKLVTEAPDGEAVYQRISQVLASLNRMIAVFGRTDNSDLLLDPIKGNVAFGCSTWGFTIGNFASIYSAQLGVEREKLLPRLWGDHYYDKENRLWKTENSAATPSKRSFVQFIVEPIIKLTTALVNNEKEVVKDMLEKLSLKLSREEEELSPKQLLRSVMGRWLNTADAVLSMAATHLPSPVVAQKYRTQQLYQGPQEDQCAIAMRECDPKGPLMVYVAKLFPSSEKGRFFAFARVFSGTVESGMRLRIMGSQYKPGFKQDLFEKCIQRVILWFSGKRECVPSVRCGNFVVLVGIDAYLAKTGTLSNCSEAFPFKTLPYSLSPVVQTFVNVKNPANLSKLIHGMKNLSKTDPQIRCVSEESG